VRINPPETSIPNSFEADIRKLIYLGDHTRLVLSVIGQDEFVAKLSRDERTPDFSRGDRIRIGWRVEDCRAFAME
jgi:putative spermidine/putrescine transport system ATP-binding protein